MCFCLFITFLLSIRLWTSVNLTEQKQTLFCTWQQDRNCQAQTWGLIEAQIVRWALTLKSRGAEGRMKEGAAPLHLFLTWSSLQEHWQPQWRGCGWVSLCLLIATLFGPVCQLLFSLFICFLVRVLQFSGHLKWEVILTWSKRLRFNWWSSFSPKPHCLSFILFTP